MNDCFGALASGIRGSHECRVMAHWSLMLLRRRKWSAIYSFALHATMAVETRRGHVGLVMQVTRTRKVLTATTVPEIRLRSTEAVTNGIIPIPRQTLTCSCWAAKSADGRIKELGLVDAIGGPLEALREARRRAGLRVDERVLVDIHPRLRTLPSLRALLRLLPGPLG